MLLQRIPSQIGNPFIQREQDPIGGERSIDDDAVRSAAKPLAGNRVGIVA